MLQIPSPVQQLHLQKYHSKNIEVFVKREDLIHETVSGNKWRKLKHNILHAKDKCYKGILTFGGAYSNHLHAAAYSCRQAGLKLICIVRAKDVDLNNPTMLDIHHWGGEIILVDRETYKLKNTEAYIHELETEYPDFYIVPEGGNNRRAKKGMKEMATELNSDYDHIFISVGTGASAIGLISNLEDMHTQVHAIAAVKDSSLISQFQSDLEHYDNWQLHLEYTRGGFAKVDLELVDFINSFYQKNGILLDPIYNAKMFLAFHQMIEENKIAENSKILLVHTGGIQGIRGHNNRYKDQPELHIQSEKVDA